MKTSLYITLISALGLLFFSCAPTGMGVSNNNYAIIKGYHSGVLADGNKTNVAITGIDNNYFSISSFKPSHKVTPGIHKVECTSKGPLRITYGRTTFSHEFRSGHTYQMNAYRVGNSIRWEFLDVSRLPEKTIFVR